RQQIKLGSNKRGKESLWESLKVNFKKEDGCEWIETAKTCDTWDCQEKKTDLQKLKKRERNRTAAYKNRQKHTERADTLHQEFERLEKDNAALRKEIQKLQQEQMYWTRVLERHEETCILLSPDIMMELLTPAPLLSLSTIEQFTDFGIL
ncbi:basic leucine zipper transcriptional factor ATF-like 2, partial [Engystomops pustulosus]|uniref:basic leucine zipper transcriptional factor ATF-like 2 n=1 Tax=Engystomops pustulosus TaxID=76066 RepID=UPI003AFA78B4